jgi:hypothetical protein
MDQEPPPSILDEIEVSRLRPPLSPGARLRRLTIGVAAVLLALLVVFAGSPTLRQDALALLSAPTPTPPPTPSAVEPTFLTTQIAVFTPAPAHAGDAVTVVVGPQPPYDLLDPQHSSIITTSTLYGPFASPAALQDAVVRGAEGPLSGTGLQLPGVPISTTISGVDTSVLTTTFHLPRTLLPGLYDFVVIMTLGGSLAAARTDVPLQIVGGG